MFYKVAKMNHNLKVTTLGFNINIIIIAAKDFP